MADWIITDKGKHYNKQGLNEDAVAILDWFQQEGRGDSIKVANALQMSSRDTSRMCISLDS